MPPPLDLTYTDVQHEYCMRRKQAIGITNDINIILTPLYILTGVSMSDANV